MNEPHRIVEMTVGNDNDGNLMIQDVTLLKNMAGLTDCSECGGSGWWNFGPHAEHCDCVRCKGTGQMLISTPW